MNTTVRDDTASVIIAAEQIISGWAPEVSALGEPCHDLPSPLPLVDEGGTGSGGSNAYC